MKNEAQRIALEGCVEVMGEAFELMSLAGFRATHEIEMDRFSTTRKTARATLERTGRSE